MTSVEPGASRPAQDPQQRPEPVEPPVRTLYPSVWAAALVGLATGVFSLGVAQLVAAFVAPSSAPVVAVGRAFIDHTPLWLKEAAISAFGTHDKQVLLTGASLVVAVLAALAGVLARRSLRAALLLIVVLGAVASLAAATRPDSTGLSVLPSVLGIGLGLVVLQKQAQRWAELQPREVDDALYGSLGRRPVLVGAGWITAAGVATGLVGWVLGGRLRGAEESRASVRLPTPADPEPPLPAGVEVGVDGVVPFRVPNEDFYRIDTALVLPRIKAEDWSLRIHGMVGREVTLTWDQLIKSDLVQRDVTMMCVSNEVGGDLIGNATWLGLPIGPLLESARPSADADCVLSRSKDGWTATSPLAVLTDGRDAMLAIGMNGEPLPIKHGFPVRMVVPGLYGYVSGTKWVVDLEVTRFDQVSAYWTDRGWSAEGPIKMGSRIDVPGDRTVITPGRRPIAGVAWLQHTGIEAVEVQVDDGPWTQAKLGAEASIDTWRQWVLPWDATVGDHDIKVRAYDAKGQEQSDSGDAPVPDGATGWHRIRVTVK